RGVVALDLDDSLLRLPDRRTDPHARLAAELAHDLLHTLAGLRVVVVDLVRAESDDDDVGLVLEDQVRQPLAHAPRLRLRRGPVVLEVEPAAILDELLQVLA